MCFFFLGKTTSSIRRPLSSILKAATTITTTPITTPTNINHINYNFITTTSRFFASSTYYNNKKMPLRAKYPTFQPTTTTTDNVNNNNLNLPSSMDHHRSTIPATRTSLPEDDDDPDDVLFSNHFGGRVIELNRPKKLNSLTTSMFNKILPRLVEYEKSDLTQVVIIKGIGRAFCAGGDLGRILHGFKAGTQERLWASSFFGQEYSLNYLIATYKKPFVALLDGITMGGGAGLSVHCPFRIATENTLFAMPETTIGLFPDVGSSFFLPRLDGNLGTYLGLTSAQLKGVDVFFGGIATHYVHSTELPNLERRLCELEFSDGQSLQSRLEIVNSTIEEFVNDLPAKGPTIHGAQRIAIDKCFDRFRPISHTLSSLESMKNSQSTIPEQVRSWASETLETLHQRSPTSVCVTLEQMRIGREFSLAEAFIREHAMVSKFGKHADLVEGITARIFERRKGRPNWKPNTIDQVTPEQVQAFFNIKPEFELLVDDAIERDYKERVYEFGLPSEKEILASLFHEDGSSMSESELTEMFIRKTNGKIGVREKVADVLDRARAMA